MVLFVLVAILILLIVKYIAYSIKINITNNIYTFYLIYIFGVLLRPFELPTIFSYYSLNELHEIVCLIMVFFIFSYMNYFKKIKTQQIAQHGRAKQRRAS